MNEQKDRNCSILDMCTGSGCIAISLKKLGGYRHVEGADISEKALKVAKKNAEDILGMDRDTELVSVKTVLTLQNKIGKIYQTVKINMIILQIPSYLEH